jgi:reverse transcriptase-like protein
MRFVSRQDPSLCDDTSESQIQHLFPYSDLIHSAVPIVSTRVSLPSVAGTARLLDLLPPHLVQRYSDWTQVVRLTPAQCKVRPRGFSQASEYYSLIHRLHLLGMVVFKREVRVVNGLFAVVKDKDSLRLIIDARPANAVFTIPEHTELPTPDILAQLQTTSSFFAAKVDLDNFYHRLLLPQWMQPFFGLPPVPAHHFGFPDDGYVYPCCTTLPMGWSHSVFLAQSCHEHILNTSTPLQPSDRLTPSSDFRLDRSRHQVYIDDLILVGADRQHLSELQQQYMTVMKDKNLPPKMTKVVEPKEDGVECLGLMVDGRRRTVGMAVPKLQLLIRDTRHLLSKDLCTGDDMARVVGRWSWAILACRPAFSVFNSVYRFIQAAGRRLFTIWRTVRRELWTIIGLAPLLFSSVDSPWFDRILSTDASESGMGVVVARASDQEMDTVASLPKIPSKPIDTSPLHWSTIVSTPWSKKEHINVLEVRALSTAVRWAISRPASLGCRLLSLSDSQVVVFAVSKGRSSSFQILRRLRYLSSMLLAGGLRLLMRWIPSTANPADAPSRRYGA